MNKIGLFLGLLLFGISSFGQTIHLLPVIDTLDPRVGEGCEVSWERLRAYLTKIRPSVIGGLALYEYRKNRGGVPTRSDIDIHYRDTPFEKDDIIWFHYCGHGEMDRKRQHILKVPGGDVTRSELRKWMEARKTQGVLITTDACAVRGSYDRPVLEPGHEFPYRDIGPWARFSQLVGGIRGTVDITASTGMTPAFVDHQRIEKAEIKGALFTNALLALFKSPMFWVDANKDGEVDWGEAFEDIRESTRRQFDQMRGRAEALGQWQTISHGANEQIPYAYSLGEELKERRSKLPVGVWRAEWRPAPSADRFLIKLRLPQAALGKKVMIVVHLFDKEGKLVKGNDPKYQTSAGGAAAWITAGPLKKSDLDINDNSPWEILIPYEKVEIWNAESFRVSVEEVGTNTRFLDSTLFMLREEIPAELMAREEENKS